MANILLTEKGKITSPLFNCLKLQLKSESPFTWQSVSKTHTVSQEGLDTIAIQLHLSITMVTVDAPNLARLELLNRL